MLAFASSFQTRFVRAGLTDMLNGTGLDDWELLEVESGKWLRLRQTVEMSWHEFKRRHELARSIYRICPIYYISFYF